MGVPCMHSGPIGSLGTRVRSHRGRVAEREETRFSSVTRQCDGRYIRCDGDGTLDVQQLCISA
jgi:hypothetical protein